MALETKKKGNLYTITCGSRTEIINSRLEQEDGNPKAKAVAIKRKKKKVWAEKSNKCKTMFKTKEKKKRNGKFKKNTALWAEKWDGYNCTWTSFL